MEIRISTENLMKALWIASVALSVIGFLLMLYGLIAALALDGGARINEALRPVSIIAAGAAMAIIPRSLAVSVSNLLDRLDGSDESQGTP